LVELLLFNERGKLDRTVVQYFNAGRGATNAHCSDRRLDLHAAVMRHLASDKSERALGQTHQARIEMAMRIIHKFIDFHASVRGNAK